MWGRPQIRPFNRSAVLLALLVAGCTDPVDKKPTTFAVVVDADSVVRDETVRVEVEVDMELEEGSGWKDLDRRSYRVDPRPIRWPIEFKPPTTKMLGESYGLLATAYDEHGAVVARAQAIRPGKQAVEAGLQVHFETQCFRQTALCTEGSTCHRGACVSARDDAPPPTVTESNPITTATTGASAGPKDGLAQEGESCSREGDRACNGHGTRVPMRCQGGAWHMATQCGESERCDTAPGETLGQCKAIASECVNQQVDVPFCDAETMRVCTDLVSSKVRPCDEHRRCAQGMVGAECKCEPGYVEAGMRCVEGTQCGADQGGCDPLTKCSMTGGVRVCSACPTGYTGTGEAGCQPLLQALTLDGGALEPAFNPSVRAYRVRIPITMPRVTLTATAPNDTQVSFDSVAVPNGQSWTSPVLDVGEHGVELALTTGFGESTRYALTIERTGVQRAYIKASNSERNDWFGFSLAASGDRFVSGSVYEDSAATSVNGDQGNGAEGSGAAYVFVRSGPSWSQEAYLKASDAQANDNFGASASMDGDTIAIGAVRSSLYTALIPGARSGAAYVYAREGSKWMERQRLAASNAQSGDQFGMAVALSGDTLAIGATYGSAPNGPRGGAVYVFQRENAGWVERQIITPSTATSLFGENVVLSGDRMLVGAPGEDSEAGAAYVFVRRAGAWQEEQRLRPDSIEAGSKFGWSVALLGDRAAVGAPHHPRASSSALVPPGEVYVFERDAERWQQTVLMRAPIPDQSDFFGASLALTPQGLTIGSNGETSASRGVNSDATNNAARFAGAAYVFANTGRSSWESSVYIKTDNAQYDACLGYIVALAGDKLVVSAPYENSVASGVDSVPTNETGAYHSGAVYVFE